MKSDWGGGEGGKKKKKKKNEKEKKALKIHITQLLTYNGEGEPKDTHIERMSFQWIDGNVWMTIRMTFREICDATTEQRLYVTIHVMASKRRETKTKAF